MKIQYSKGKVPKQAHVAIPEGLYEEEHGRQGFFGPVTQFYHLHPTTDWKRIEGPLQPRAFNTYDLKPTDLDDPRGEPAKVLYNNDAAVFISRRSERSEEHTSELQSLAYLVCRLLLEKKK